MPKMVSPRIRRGHSKAALTNFQTFLSYLLYAGQFYIITYCRGLVEGVPRFLGTHRFSLIGEVTHQFYQKTKE